MVDKHSFGKLTDGRETALYTLKNKNGMSVSVTDYGAAVTSVVLPDGCDVVLGFDDCAGYEAQDASIGVICGRHANRIRRGVFELDGKKYTLAVNNGKNHLHGGEIGFSKRLFAGEITGESVRLTYVSADGEEGYPGTLVAEVTYSLSDTNELVMKVVAKTDKATVVNLASHGYFNLAGHGAGSIEGHSLEIEADYYTPLDEEVCPNGEIRRVLNTPLDFTKEADILSRIDADCEQLRFGSGYDHNFVLKKKERCEYSLAAVLSHKESGRNLEIRTTLPGVQLYTANFLNTVGKGGAVYMPRGAVCLETQLFPNAMEHTHFPSPVLREDALFEHTTGYRFSVSP